MPELIPFYHYGMAGPRFSFARTESLEKLDGYYEACFPESDGMAVFVRSNSNDNEFYGAIDLKGERLIKPVFSEIGSFSEGLAPARMASGKFGYINHSGAWFIAPRWASAGSFRNGRAIVGNGTQFGVINRSGQEIVPLIYEEFYWPSGLMSHDNYAVVKDAHRGWGLLNLTTLSESVRCNWEEIKFNIGNGLVPVKMKNKWGFADMKGKLIVPCLYENTEGFSEGLASVILNGKSGYINTSGQVVIPIEYNFAGYFFEGTGAVYSRTDGKWLWLDQTGKILKEFSSAEYNLFGRFSEGRIRFAKRDSIGKLRWGFMDHSGNVVIQPIYGECTDFAWGRASVSGTTPYNDVLWGLINPFGDPITKIKYSRLYPLMGFEGILWYCEGGQSLMSTPMIDRNGIEYFSGRGE